MREWIYTVIVYVQEVIWGLHFQSLKRDMTIEWGNPPGDRDLSNLHNYPWVVLLQRTAFQWWRHGKRGLLLAENGILKLRTAPSW